MSPFKLFYTRPRLFFSFLIAVFIAFVLPESAVHQSITRAIIGWDVGALIYLTLAAHMMFGSTHEKMQARARVLDEGKFVILILVVLAVFFTLGAIIAELANVKGQPDTLRYSHICLAVITILISWFFTHTMFALHYAHNFYSSHAKNQDGGLKFPDCDKPDYFDFLYFAFIIGTSGQTADVDINSKHMRRVSTIHCVLAFFFNTTLLALTINIASGLI